MDSLNASLYDFDFADLEARLSEWGESRAWAREVWRAVYRQGIGDFEQATALPPSLRARLAEKFSLALPARIARQESSDGARKDLLQLADGAQIEVVLMTYRHRLAVSEVERRSACISTQVGCACGCTFCATGQMGFVRQLTSGEIVAQVMGVQRDLLARGESLSNFVLMGMGEPLLNYENTLAAIRRLCDPRGWGFVERRITLSTAGIVPGIDRLADEGLHVNLAVSLHVATDVERSALMPINRRYPLDDLFVALRRYTAKTRRRVLLEWVLIGGVTDTPEQVAALAARVGDIPAHINLIQITPTPDFAAQPSSPEAIEAFTAILDRAGIPHTMRQRRGAQIAAGCGQLRSQMNVT